MIYSNSQVTMELRDVLAMVDDDGNPFELFDFDYPCYYTGDEKLAFEQKIIDHYYFHQIGSETVARFKHNFRSRMREIMPYYNQFYKSCAIMDAIEDPFGTVDVTETFEQTTTGNDSGSETVTGASDETSHRSDSKQGSADNTRRFSNTPQGSIENLDNYLTEATVEGSVTDETAEADATVTREDETSRSSESERRGTTSYTLTRKGSQGVTTYAHDMMEFRQSFINVDMMVIGALRDLFLLIY